MGWPLGIEKQTRFESWAIFGAARDYDGDGVYDDIHEGLDFYVEIGDPVLASLDGVVVWASDQRRSGGASLYGIHVIIEHADGWITWYAHLDQLRCSVGKQVSRGDLIGLGGNTGNSTGPHLHYTVQHIGYGDTGYVIPDVVNPQSYL